METPMVLYIVLGQHLVLWFDYPILIGLHSCIIFHQLALSIHCCENPFLCRIRGEQPCVLMLLPLFLALF